jgi:leucyl aminopeptidase
VRIVLSERDPATLAVDALLLPFEDVSKTQKLPLHGRLAKDASVLAPREAESYRWVGTRRSRAPLALLVRLPETIDAADLESGACGSPRAADAALAQRRARLGLGAKIQAACSAEGRRRVLLWTAEDLGTGLDLIEGMVLRSHAYTEFLEEPPSGLRQLTWAVPKAHKGEARRRLDQLLAKLEGANFARTLADLPPNRGEPDSIVERVEAHIEGLALESHALGRDEISDLEMGLFVGVARGSSSQPRLLVLEHRPEGTAIDATPELALVGKGVTIDAGGYNLKSSGIHDMNYDKAGAAAVIGAMSAIARAKLPLHVVAACPLVENLLGPAALRPGEILRSYGGRSVFIENTDAEGRLVLADVLAWLCEREPRRVVDLATLTAASNVALGEPYAALFCNDDELRDALLGAGMRADESLWPMPIHELHDRELAHPRADLRNVGAHAGGASAAAAFLRYFVSGAWAHVDLAGKAANVYERDYMGPGATGFGARLLFELAVALAGEDRGEGR